MLACFVSVDLVGTYVSVTISSTNSKSPTVQVSFQHLLWSIISDLQGLSYRYRKLNARHSTEDMCSCVVFTCHPPILSISTLSYLLNFAGHDIWFQAHRWIRKYLEGFFLLLLLLLLFSCVDCVVHFAYRNLWPDDNKDDYVKKDAGHTQIMWFCFKQYASYTSWFNQLSAAFYLWAHR